MEWKLGDKQQGLNRLIALKPSLVEWKHKKQYRYMSAEFALKPSLVEWKQISFRSDPNDRQTLKPSLVEWKLERLDKLLGKLLLLETFLGGMETKRRR